MFCSYSGGRSAYPPPAASESAAGRAGPEEALRPAHAEQEHQSAHPAAIKLPFISARLPHNQPQPDLHPQSCSFDFPESQPVSVHPTQMDGQAEEEKERS